MGYLEAMANHGNADARIVVTDAFFYKPHPAGQRRVARECTQVPHARIDRVALANLAPEVWNKVCDRIDISLFSWAGTDSNDDGYYKHTGEPAFAEQLSLFRRYSMGTRRANFTLEGSPDRYCWIDHTHPRQGSARPHVSIRRTTGTWSRRKADRTTRPVVIYRGYEAAARREPIDTTPPKLTASATDNRDGTFTVTGSAHHLDGIRCVRGYVHPKKSERVAAKMTFNVRTGSYQTNYDAATQDFTPTVDGKSGQYLMITAVSIHDQEHSIRVQL